MKAGVQNLLGVEITPSMHVMINAQKTKKELEKILEKKMNITTNHRLHNL